MVGNYFTTKQLRAFRIPVDNRDGIKLGLFQNEQQIVDSQNIFVKDISLTGVGFSSTRELRLGSQIELHLEFADYVNIIDAVVVRSQEINNEHIVGVVFKFEEGESFDTFFQKFIKNFSTRRLKAELLNLIDEQNFSSTHASELMILNEIQGELQAYGNSPLYLESLFTQIQEKIHASSIDIFFKETDSTNYYHLESSLERSVGYNVSESILSRVLEDRSTLNALVVSDMVLGSDKFIRNYKDQFIICEPITDTGGDVKGFALASRGKEFGKFNEVEISLMKLFAHESGRYEDTLENQMSLEPVKYLNPKKPREFAMIGSSEKVQEMRSFVSQAKSNTEPVCLRGEKGVGRKLMAKIVHSEGKLGHMEFLEFDGEVSLHGEQIEYIISSHRLPLDYKNTGTIYISNFDKMDSCLQKKLMRFAKDNKGLFRIIVSLDSHVELDEEVLKFFKNNKLRIPELNQRKEDIPSLVNFLIKKECKKRGLLNKTVSRNVLDKFKNHDWKGNVRELKIAVSRLVSWYSSNHYIDSFPPESYQVFEEVHNTEFDSSPCIEQMKSLQSNFSKEQMVDLIKWGVISAEMKKYDNNLKKTALALGKPLEDVVSMFERGQELLSEVAIKKAA